MGNNNQNKKPRPNYFSNNINKSGECFLDFKKAGDIQNDAPRIFRELARRSINLEVYGHYFLEKHFLENLIEVAKNKTIFHNITFQTMNYSINIMNMNGQLVDQDTINVAYTHKNICEVYNIIYYHLDIIYRSGMTDLKPLYVLCDILSRNPIYKNSIL